MNNHSPQNIIRRMRATITEKIERRRYNRQLARFTHQGIEPELSYAGASVLAWVLSTCKLQALPSGHRDRLSQAADQIYLAVAPAMRATYGLLSPGDLPPADEVLKRFTAMAARAVPGTLPRGVNNLHEHSMDIHERTYIAEALLRYTLAEILIHPVHLTEDLS